MHHYFDCASCRSYQGVFFGRRRVAGELRRSSWIAWALLALMVPLAPTRAAEPVEASQAIGPVVIDGCMQDVYLKYGGQGSGLNCTANDVQITDVIDVFIHPVDVNDKCIGAGTPFACCTGVETGTCPLEEGGCAFPGDTVTIDATFEILTSAARHDIGLYFAQDGGNALTGSCLISILDWEPSNENCLGAGNPYACCTGAGTGTCPAVDLDKKTGTIMGCQNDNTLPCLNDAQCASVGGPCVNLGPGVQDTCGDITNDSRNPLYHTVNNMTFECVDTTGDGVLDVAACVSWRQPGNNQLCLSPLYAFPGSPSKCRCDTALSLKVPVPPDPCDPEPDCSHLDTECATYSCNVELIDLPGNCAKVEYAPLSTACESDGDLCTIDQCDGAGTCETIDTVDCSHLDDQCNDGACNPATGLCEAIPKSLSTSCEADGDLCTIDHCNGAGSCVTFDNVDCSHQDDQCNDGACNPATGLCESTPKSLSTSCEADGDLCTIDHCDGNGACVTFDTVDCSHLDDQCSDGVCNTGTGACQSVPKALSTSCETDGNLCTLDHCDGDGTCVTFDTVDCSHLDDQCNDGACNPATGLCGAIPKSISTSCEADGDLCTIDHCDGAGACVTFNNVDCSRIDQCTDSVCNSGTGSCEPVPDPLSTPCDADGDLCTLDHCDGNGNCVNIDDVDCSHLDTQCQDGACNPTTGACQAIPKALGTTCEADGNLCTLDHCDGNGSCVTFDVVNCPGSTGQCDAGENCNPANGQCETMTQPPPGAPCSEDGDACTLEHCDGAGNCVVFDVVDCSHLDDQCNDGVCDSATGGCSAEPKALSTPCEADGSLCTMDHCDGNGSCVTFDSVDCSHLDDQCNDGACNPATGLCGAIPKSISTSCEADGDLCTIDHCDGAGACVTFNNVDCSHLDEQCSDGVCNTGTGACESVPKALSTSCEADGDLCTIDHCDGNGSCVTFDTVDCAHLDDQCNDGVCNTGTGACESVPKALSTSCQADGDLCTIDHCDGNGACVTFDTVDCSHLDDQCNDGVCNTGTGACESVPKALSTPCEADGDLCTIDHCDGAGACVTIDDVVCPRIDQCNDAVCNSATGACDTVPDPLSTPCEADGDLCTNDHCDGSGACVTFDSIDCSHLTVDCNNGVCDTGTGSCIQVPKADSTPCTDDGFSCTSDVCVAGVCTHIPNHAPCVDGVFCTDTRCDPGDAAADPVTGCVVEPNHLSCDDGVDCTNADVCDPDHPEADGSGCVITPVDEKCDDFNPCTDDFCDHLGKGQCVNDCRTPGITCPDDLVFECDDVGDFGDPVIDDDCSVSPLVECTEEVEPGKLPQESRITRTCTVTNDCGNTASCEQIIDIFDTTPPEITCPPDLVFECDDIGEFGEPVVTDNCDPDPEVDIEVEIIEGDCRQATVAGGVTPPPKTTIVRTITSADGTTTMVATGGGPNIVQCVQQIDIIDTTPPVLVGCGQPLQACVGEVPLFFPPTCTDTCGTCEVTCTRSDGAPLNSPVESLPLTITCVAVDECDNLSAPCDIPVEDGFCAIPTTSEWGLVCLTLLLLSAAKIYFGVGQRRRLA